MKRILVPTASAADWQRLLAEPEKHWKQGKSAMCVAESWETAHPRLPSEIASALQETGDPRLVDLELVIALPEWKVGLPGKGNPTQSDVMAICRNESGLAVLAVEAKVDEPFGPTVAEKRNGASPGQLNRLAFLEDLLGLAGKPTDGLRYQLLHRTAAAVLTARAFHAGTAVMVVQSFAKGSPLRVDYQAFVGAIGGRPDAEMATHVPGHQAPQLYLGWVNCEKTVRDDGGAIQAP